MTPEELQAFGPQYLRQHYDTVRPHPCWACQMHHCTIVRLQEGPLAGKEGEEPEFEGYTMMGPQIGNYDSKVATSLANECDRYGFDINELGWTMGFAMECFEKGLLTKEQTGGLELKFGNIAAARGLMRKIAQREGIGNLLAEGGMRAAKAIGGSAPTMAIHTMAGNSPLGHDHRPSWPMMFDISVANTGCYEMHLSPRAANVGLKDIDLNSWEDSAHWVAATKWCAAFFDSLGICRLPNREFPDILVGLVKAAAGWDYTFEEARTMGFRTIALLRANNIRHGHTPALDRPSPRYGSIPVDGPHKGRDISPYWNGMLDIYYRDLGWDTGTGKPAADTLKRLGLDFVVQELWGAKS
jgi:aldehyde:ferredoxin oxidoreductase